MLKECNYCEEKYVAKNKRQKYCSNKCRTKFHNEKKQKRKRCVVCGKILKNHRKKYCSDKCFDKHRKEYKANLYKHKCDRCGKHFSNGQKHQRFCSTKCQYEWQRDSKEYRKVMKRKLSLQTRETREKEYKNKFEEKYPDFKYYSGYTDAESTIKIKCKICGYIQERNANCAKPSRDKELRCDNCERIRIEEKAVKEKKERNKRRKKYLKYKIIILLKDKLERIYREPLLHKTCKRCGTNYKANATSSIHCNKCIKEIIQEEIELDVERSRPIKCEECGKEFIRNIINQIYCSKECCDKSYCRIKEIRRREKIFENGRVNYKISLDKLIRRDDGICQICGEPIDKNDYTRTNEGYFVVGNSYPSLDHIVPVNKGGTHTWDNVQLAHHYCNSVKSDKIII